MFSTQTWVFNLKSDKKHRKNEKKGKEKKSKAKSRNGE